MTQPDHDGPQPSHVPHEVRLVCAPAQHAGLGRALRDSFGSAPRLPEDLARLLDRLR